MSEPSVARSLDHPNVQLQCRCSWSGLDADITDWDVQPKRDRVVRKCPDCGEPVPEWGTLRPIDGASRIARGSLADALAEAGYLERNGV
ncbi:hypothetical protein [Halosolutus gelatinilyticus]|uniref:hypothetical protein n=1 Tax=Halosolutus gelatinilyticus TaxID=2931975 RepID=UPI001FF4CF69|nr:hypothetical protein [Halosolutus gelatinilyticus]